MLGGYEMKGAPWKEEHVTTTKGSMRVKLGGSDRNQG